MIVVGGSLGAAAALREILLGLPAGWNRPIAVVLHRARDTEESLMPVLQRGLSFPVEEPADKDPILPGRIYLAPADYHLLIDREGFALSTDDPVHFARPAVDALFESAAEWQGSGAVGVVLTGYGADGALGARRIADEGGLVIVQDPATADASPMPSAARAAVPEARVLPLREIARALAELPRPRAGA